MTDLSDVWHYFGKEVDVNLNKKTISLRKWTYLKKILSQYGMSNYKPANIFISSGIANFLTPYKNEADKSTIV